MIGMLIAGIVGMTLMFWLGVKFGQRIEHDKVMDLARDAARIVIDKNQEHLINKLQEIGK